MCVWGGSRGIVCRKTIFWASVCNYGRRRDELQREIELLRAKFSAGTSDGGVEGFREASSGARHRSKVNFHVPNEHQSSIRSQYHDMSIISSSSHSECREEESVKT